MATATKTKTTKQTNDRAGASGAKIKPKEYSVADTRKHGEILIDRSANHQQEIEEYAEMFRDPDLMTKAVPPLRIHETGTNPIQWKVTRGGLLLHAAERAGKKLLQVEFVYHSTIEAAIDEAIRENRDHGARLTRADRFLQLDLLFKTDPKWKRMSLKSIMRAIGCSEYTVSAYLIERGYDEKRRREGVIAQYPNGKEVEISPELAYRGGGKATPVREEEPPLRVSTTPEPVLTADHLKGKAVSIHSHAKGDPVWEMEVELAKTKNLRAVIRTLNKLFKAESGRGINIYIPPT